MKTLKSIVIIALGLAMAVNLNSCKKEKTEDPPPTTNNDPLKDFVKIGEQDLHHGGLSIGLFMKENPFVGYNYVAVKVTETGHDNVVKDASVMIRPMMDMGSMMHSTPVEQPQYDDAMEAYMGTATFIMPSMGGDWSFEVIAGPAGATPDTVSFDITVQEKTEARLYQFISAVDGSTPIFVALKEPMKPKVGLNNFELMIYKRQNMMSFPPATDLKVDMEPKMPTMGHGSPNNTDPVHIENGLYRGEVNFTMTGYWKVNISINDSSDALMDDEGYFDITF